MPQAAANSIIWPSGHALALKALEINLLFVTAGVRENNNDNRSEQIDAIEREWGLLGLAYCAMGECHVFAKALCLLLGRPADAATITAAVHHDLSHYFDPSPSCQDMVDAAVKRGSWRRDIRNAKPGDLVFFSWNGTSHASHVGMVKRVLPVGSVATIEWNTTPGPGGNQSDGGGVYERTRGQSVILGYLSINSGT